MSALPEASEWAAARESRVDKGHATRTQLLDAAAAVFGRLGYARTTTALIAREAEVSRPSFYVYFASKEAAFLEVAARVRDDFLAAHDTSGVDESDPVALGRAGSRGFLAAFASHRDLLTVIEHQAIADPAIAEMWAELQDRPLRRIARHVRQLANNGLAEPAASPETVALATLGLFERAGRTAPKDRIKFAQLVDELTAIWFRLIGIKDAS